jgi:hypothetical protein
VAALVAPRAQLLANATAPDGKPLPQERAQEVFAATCRAYESADAAAAVTIFRGSHDETTERMRVLLAHVVRTASPERAL